MKKIIFLLTPLLFFTACKDKKKNDPEPIIPVEQTKQIRVKINGTEFSCTNCGNTYESGGMHGINFSEGTTNRLLFNMTGFLQPGTYTIVPFGNPAFNYEKDGRYYRGYGKLTITETDTSSSGSIKKFIGAFDCVTDTNNGVFYNFTEGVLNINFN